MIKPVIAGNWKMNKTISEAVDFAVRLRQAVPATQEREVIIAPPFTALQAVADILRGSPILLSAQNVHEEEKGAYTGEISAGMLREAGCSCVIVGHSERRTLFGEGDDRINRKLRAALAGSLRPIFCVGETLQEREDGHMKAVIGRQLKEGLNNLTTDDIKHLIIAYEPVWAIGTGRTASPGQAEEVHRFIRDWLDGRFGGERAKEVAILYGGSVTGANAGEFMAQPEIDGALIGGASLKPAEFVSIVKQTAELIV